MKLAYVGLPCQIEGLRKAEAISKEIKQDWMTNVTLQVGLFCRENWSYTCFRALVQDDYGINLGDVVKFDIKKNNIIAHKKDGSVFEFPLKESKPYVRIGCMVCLDFTAELADISIGAVGTPHKWSTVIARTKKGMELLKGAEKEGYIEVKPIEQVKPGIRLIKKIAKEKFDASMAEIKSREEVGIAVPHIKSSRIEKFKKDKGFAELNFEIIDTGLCSVCGTCEVVCPAGVIKIIEERPTLIGSCQRHCTCYYSCPRVSLPSADIKNRIFENASKEEGIGNSIGIFSARALNSQILEKAQDGGAVTALLKYALHKKIIDGVVSVEAGKEPWKPEPVLSTRVTGGTFYSYATTIPILKEVKSHVIAER